MSTPYASLPTLEFLLYQVHQLDALLDHPRYRDYDAESVNILLQAARDFADQELFPYFEAMDAEPARFIDGEIVVHPQLGTIIRKASEAGWIGATFDYEQGGMQLPHLVQNAVLHLFEAANNSVVGYLGLTTGAARLILSFGSSTLQETYVPHMLAGRWMGTMALTEPQAGSSMLDLRTTARPTDEGHYLLTGQKIFISGGDHDQAENFVHLMLARIEGAPPGNRGISLFVVPKLRPTDSGKLVPNDVTTAGDFQKMGQRGYCTAHLVMGEGEDCRGWLVGEPHQGLKYMFQMMNAARIDVGLTAASTATAAYHASLKYAHERAQGRRLGQKNPAGEPAPIIEHPDVRRMLLLQKAIVEGSLSLLLECSRYSDLQEVNTGAESERYRLLLELLTPIAKTYPAEKGREAIDNGLQVLGGYGFCMDFPLQQYYRDVRIMAIYEGTTGIQSLDLLGRKVGMKEGQAMNLLLEEVQKTLDEAAALDALQPLALELEDSFKRLQGILNHLWRFAKAGDQERFLADATLFMEMMGIIVVGWQWLKMGVAAKRALLTQDLAFPADFYESKLLAMRFYFRYEMPKTLGLEQTLLDESVLTVAQERAVIL